MTDWWEHLSELNRTLYGIAICISIPFVWQLAAALLGLAHGGDADGMDSGSDTDADGDVDGDGAVEGGDSIATALAFKLLSLRAILTFFVLFFWAAALYLERGRTLSQVFGISVLWGLGGMASVALLLHLLPKLAHAGTRDLESALGSEATVYLDIPAGGTGEVRVVVSGSVSYIKARTLHGEAVKAGMPVTVCKRIDQALLVVDPLPTP